MTDAEGAATPPWVPVLRDISRASGHELRNALNALVVNLEVVRARAGRLDESVQPFMAQAVEQSEESVRLAEGTIALLNLLVDAVSPDGSLRLSYVSPRGVRIESEDSVSQRAARALGPLAARVAMTAESGDMAVILSFAEKSLKKNQEHE